MIQVLTVYAFVFLFGAALGSFLNVCISRIPSGLSIVNPPSRCPGCGHRIAFYDNIPILSYLFLRGRCRGCGEHISLQYPLVEFVTALLILFLFVRFGLTSHFGVTALLVLSLVVITFIDLEHQIIPDSISLPGIIIGFAASFLPGAAGWLSSLIGIVVGGGSLLLIATTYEKVTGKEGMGGGDVKLLAMLGAFLGWKAVPFIIFTGSLVGSVIGISAMSIQKKGSDLKVPFGPFLAFGAILYIFFGEEIIAWYLTLGGAVGG